MKYLIVLLGLVAVSQATFFGLFKKHLLKKHKIPIHTNGAGLSIEDILLYNELYNTNGFGYYPTIQHQPQPIQYINVPPAYIVHEKVLPNQYLTPVQVSVPEIHDIDLGLPKVPEESVIFRPLEIAESLPAPIPIAESIPVDLPEAQVQFTPEIPVVVETKEEAPIILSTKYGVPDADESTIALPINGVPLDFKTGAYLTTKYPSPLFVTPPEEANQGEYSHAYVLSDGTKVFEEGHLAKTSNGNEVIVKSGHYEYVSDDGKLIEVKWIADENGFRILE